MHEEAEHQRDSSGVAAPPAAVVCETKNRVVSVLEYPVSKTPISIVGGTTEGGIITVAVASAMFKRKGEDYATVCRSTEEEPKLLNYQSLKTPLVAFVGVFDGHDGRSASNYCSKGLLQHVVIETEACMNENKACPNKESPELLKQAYSNAFHSAQTRFGMEEPPPKFQKLGRRRINSNLQRSSILRFFRGKPQIRRGGTTACTISIYAGADKPFALVANCGDSRMITDDGTSSFRTITHDHRPGEAAEHARLRECRAYMTRATTNHVVRIFPGGLGLSRSIGDLGCCPGVIPTPDVFIVPLTASPSSKDCTNTRRFVIASDGLWDFVDTETVGKLAAQARDSTPGTHHTSSPKDAATEILEYCMARGGTQDDVTILVVDVTTTR